MRRTLLALSTFVVLLVPVPIQAQELVFGLFSEYLESLRAQAGLPGLAAAIVGPEEILWEGAYGRQDLEQSVATRTDTPFHADGLTQLLTTSMVLRCVEERRLSLDDRVGAFKPDSLEPNATIRQVLSHTSGPADGPVFDYRLERFEPLWLAIRSCTGDSYRETLANLLERLAMVDSIPGMDATQLRPPAEGVPSTAALARYTRALQRLAVPYSVDGRGRAIPSQYPSATLTPSNGLVTTVRDFAKFDLALRQGLLLNSETLNAAWRPVVGAAGAPLPHGLGWFTTTYNGEPVVWQFGVGEGASSALVVTAPRRGLSLILLSNSDRLVRPFDLEEGDLMVSPFARLFLRLFVR
jgi:CubicO group peptidase (beta-lactamase class C family)